VIGEIQKWSKDPVLGLPVKYQSHFKNKSSDLWRRHFKFPFDGTHASVSHTYEAKLWQIDESDFSFLPLDRYGTKVAISFDNLNNELANKIRGKVKGKYPVLLSDAEVNLISNRIQDFATIKVLRNIISDIAVS
jgi:hypothetical protein